MQTLATPSTARTLVGLMALGVLVLVARRGLVPPSEEPPKPDCPIQLHDVTGETGIDFQHTDGSSGRRYIVEAMSAGLAVFDYDGDGLEDLYFLNGAPLPGTHAVRPPRNALYKNLGGFRFREVTDEAGVGDTGYGLGVAVADYDNDGQPDLFLNNYGSNVLYRNLGNGTFADVTDAAGVAKPDPSFVGAGACFLDIDNDGYLDLYVGNYIRFDPQAHVPHFTDGIPRYPQPMEYQAVPDTLYRNRGDGTFADVSVSSRIAEHAGTAMGMVSADYDNDGLADMVVANDVGANFLFHNEGHATFEEVGVTSGVAYNSWGDSNANMAVACGDYDNDRQLDFFITSYQNQLPVLYRNLGGGVFEDVTLKTGAGAGCYPFVNWGCAFADFDNDGWKDLFIANGHLEDNIELRDRSTSYECPNVVLRNLGGAFENVSERCGDGLSLRRSSRGAVVADLDRDGWIDVVVLNSRREPTVLRNVSPRGNHWIGIRLVGVKTNRDGVGARVTVTAGDLTQIDEVHSGHGYQSHWGPWLHFGLGKRKRVDRVEVRWIGGGTDVLESVPADQRLVIVESSAANVASPR